MPECFSTYVIRSGDTLSKIAKRFGVSVNELLNVNPNINPNNLKIGTIICIPATLCPYGTRTYAIKAGDTFGGLARTFATTVADIIAVNPDVNYNNLVIGQTVCIPQPMPVYPPCPTRNFYVIRRGDTLSVIAKTFGITVAQLTNSNQNINPNNLQVGQIICIPLAPSPTSIVINVTAKTLTFNRAGQIVREFPIATGSPNTPTPIGSFTIINKEVDPGGPYGTRWLGLSARGYGIHGTNNPSSIGKSVSNGCIRMFNRDIEELFSNVGVTTVVRILP